MSRFDCYDTDARRALAQARETAMRLNHRTICTEHLLYGLLDSGDVWLVTILANLGVNTARMRQALDFVIGKASKPLTSEPRLSTSARRVLDLAEEEGSAEGVSVGTHHLLLGLLREGEGIAAGVLESFGVTSDRVLGQIHAVRDCSNIHTAFAAEHQARYNMTPTLNSVSHDLTSAALAGLLDPVIGREEEIERAMQVLSRRSKNNPVLIGEAGVGKTAIAEGLAQRIVDGQVSDLLRSKRVVSLDVGLLTVGTKYRGDFEERLRKILDEIVAAANVILFVDEIQVLIGAGVAEGSVDAGNLLKPMLARGEFQCIGATTIDDYRKAIEKDPALERRFQPIKVRETTPEETIRILRELRPRYEEFHGVRITDEAIAAAVKLSSRFIQTRKLPDKAIDLIDEASARLRVERAITPSEVRVLRSRLEDVQHTKDSAIHERQFDRASELRDRELEMRQLIADREDEWLRMREETAPQLTAEHIGEVIVMWTGIPAVRVSLEESRKLLNLESDLRKRVVGQDAAIRSVAAAVRRSRTELRDPRRPIGSFIFAGPTGVGKTELAKALASVLFGTEDALIKIDMSEFMEHHQAARLVGAPPGYVGYDQAGQLTEAVKRRPYSVVLFDEIEKAHPQVFDMLLQVLEDGRLADAKGREVDFRNTIVIMTSNAGAELLGKRSSFGFTGGKRKRGEVVAESVEQMRAVLMPRLQEIFRPEFLNRVDDIVVFHPLDRTQVRSILDLMLVQTQARLSEKLIELRVSDDAKDVLVDAGYDPEYGARPLRRAVQTLLEDRMAEALLRRVLKPGDCVLVERGERDGLEMRTRNAEMVIGGHPQSRRAS